MNTEIQRTMLLVHTLSENERDAVEQLAALGEQHDGAEMPYYFEPSPSVGQASGFLSYIGNKLVGFAAIQSGDEPEIGGMVHPGHRREGVGYRLLEAVREECRRRGAASLLITVNEAVPAGAAFAGAVGAERSLGEYRMALDLAAINRERPVNASLRLRQATTEDIPAIVRVTAAAFGDPEDAFQSFVEREIELPNRRFFVAELAGEPIGSLRVSREDEGVFITTLGVLPLHQGHGYGRQILADIVDILIAEGQREIMLEVATDNRNALTVYHACGFRETAAYGYYRLVI